MKYVVVTLLDITDYKTKVPLIQRKEKKKKEKL